MEHLPKLNEKHTPILHCISSFEDKNSYKNLSETTTSCLISYCFTLAFTSADIIFHNFLELRIKLLEKRFRH